MYFKITDKNSPAFASLNAYFEKYDAAKAACDAFTRRNNGEAYGWNSYYMVGVNTIQTENPPAGWRPCPEFGDMMWTFDRRTKAGRALEEEAATIPRVTVYDVCKAIGYDFDQCLGHTRNGGCIKSTPDTCRTEDMEGFLVSLSDAAKYTPLEGMVEITKTEALRLQHGPVE